MFWEAVAPVSVGIEVKVNKKSEDQEVAHVLRRGWNYCQLFLLEQNFGPHPKLAWSFRMGNVWLAIIHWYYVVKIQNIPVPIGINSCKEFYKSKINKVII